MNPPIRFVNVSGLIRRRRGWGTLKVGTRVNSSSAPTHTGQNMPFLLICVRYCQPPLWMVPLVSNLLSDRLYARAFYSG